MINHLPHISQVKTIWRWFWLCRYFIRFFLVQSCLSTSEIFYSFCRFWPYLPYLLLPPPVFANSTLLCYPCLVAAACGRQVKKVAVFLDTPAASLFKSVFPQTEQSCLPELLNLPPTLPLILLIVLILIKIDVETAFTCSLLLSNPSFLLLSSTEYHKALIFIISHRVTTMNIHGLFNSHCSIKWILNRVSRCKE
jgi:hypothetical protein